MDAIGTLALGVLSLLIDVTARFVAWVILILNGEFVADPVALGVVVLLVLIWRIQSRRHQEKIISQKVIKTLEEVAVKQPVVVQTPGGVFSALMVGFVFGGIVLSLVYLFVL